MISKAWGILKLNEKAGMVLGGLGLFIVVIFLTRWITSAEVEGRVAAEKDAEWKMKIATAVPETSFVDRAVYLPGRKVEVPGEEIIVTVEDSAKVRELIAEVQNKDSLIYELTRTQRATDEDSIATVMVWYYPWSGTFQIWREYKPFMTQDKVITKEVLVERDPAWLRLKGGTAWQPDGFSGFAEGEVRVIDGVWVGPRVETGAKGGWSIQAGYEVEW